MIISKTVEISISSKNKKYYIEKGYNAICGEKIKVNVNDLSHASKVIVSVECDVCGEEKELIYQKYTKNIKKYGFYTCSTKCAYSKNKLTNLEKYGTEHHSQSEIIKSKLKNTIQEKYGVSNVFQLEDIKEKSKKTNLDKLGVEYPQQNIDILNKSIVTNLDKYGVERPAQSKIIYDKIIKTNLDRYGVENPLKNTTILNDMKKTNLEKYGVDNPTKNKIIIDKIKQKAFIKNIEYYKEKYGLVILNNKNDFFKIKCDICDKNYDIEKTLLHNRIHTNATICTICNPIDSNISDKENQLLNFIKDNYNGEIIMNKRNIIPPYELDIYLPDLNLAFEFNGVYWHNELHKDKNYHFNKTNLCIDNNIQLVHIWEDDWIYKNEIVKSMVLNKINKTPNRIYGRKCKIKELKDNKLIKDFLNKNHLQGFVGSSIKLGLFYEDNLVSLINFGGYRKFMNSSSNENEYELLRFCNKLNTNVIGGASKLFKYFINNYNPKIITTYADRNHSNGNLYKQLGFKLEHITKPNYYYIINGIREYRFKYRKDVLVKQGYDSNKTEHEIMLERKIYRIYNSGNYKYIQEFN